MKKDLKCWNCGEKVQREISNPNEDLSTILCETCAKAPKEVCDERARQNSEKVQKCLNPDCNSALFISGNVSPNIRGMNPALEIKEDDEGPHIQCPKCKANHNVAMWDGPKGSGGRFKIAGLRA